MSKKTGKKLKLLPHHHPTSENLSPVNNSFLQETSFNSNIDENIRQEIEKKFKKSSVNAHYVFPRTLSDTKRRRTPIKARSQAKPRLLMEKSLPALHKITKSIQDSTNILSNLVSMKKIHRATSSIRSVKDGKAKIMSTGRYTPLLTHNRSSSQCGKRSNTPGLRRGENLLEASGRRTKFRHRREEGKRSEVEMKTKLMVKKPGHLYTASMESVVPSAIIRSVAYY